MTEQREKPRVRLGVSSCLLGERVRFDGGHKRDDFLTGTLATFVEWVAVCPEFEMGMGAPRPRLRLVARDGDIRMVTMPEQADQTDAMRGWARAKLDALAGLGLDGYVLKKDSPTCGLHRVRVYNEAGMPERTGRGLFATMLADAFPTLPLEDEGRLHDPALRENFVERVFAHRRWRALLATDPGPGDLVAFHTAHKYAVLAHSTDRYRALGRMVADAGSTPFEQLLADYGAALMEALRARATPRKHANVLQHITGMLKRDLDAGDRTELAETIDAYRLGRVPLVVPLVLLKHHLRRHPNDWLAAQVYLDPYPGELLLRNHV